MTKQELREPEKKWLCHTVRMLKIYIESRQGSMVDDFWIEIEKILKECVHYDLSLTPELKEGKRPLCDGTKKINDALIDGDRTCPCCEGRGYVGVLATTSMGKCILCNGTGKQPPLQCDMNMPNIRGGGKQPTSEGWQHEWVGTGIGGTHCQKCGIPAPNEYCCCHQSGGFEKCPIHGKPTSEEPTITVMNLLRIVAEKDKEIAELKAEIEFLKGGRSD